MLVVVCVVVILFGMSQSITNAPTRKLETAAQTLHMHPLVRPYR